MKIIKTKKILQSNRGSIGIIKVSDIKSEAFVNDTKFKTFSIDIKNKYKIDEVKRYDRLNMEVKKIY